MKVRQCYLSINFRISLLFSFHTKVYLMREGIAPISSSRTQCKSTMVRETGNGMSWTERVLTGTEGRFGVLIK